MHNWFKSYVGFARPDQLAVPQGDGKHWTAQTSRDLVVSYGWDFYNYDAGWNREFCSKTEFLKLPKFGDLLRCFIFWNWCYYPHHSRGGVVSYINMVSYCELPSINYNVLCRIKVDQGLAIMVCFNQPYLLDILYYFGWYQFATVKEDKYCRATDYTWNSTEEKNRRAT